MTSSVSDFGRDHGLIHEAVITGRKAGWTADEWSLLAHSEERMREVRQYLRGHASITAIEHVIDSDANPFVPDGWSIEVHQKGGAFKWDKESQKDALHLDEGQKNGKWIEGNKLRKELANQPVLNTNVLDYLFDHPHLIPEEWKRKVVFFWGTIYRYRDGDLYVRCLHWHGGRWHWFFYWLGSDWGDGRPAAVSAS